MTEWEIDLEDSVGGQLGEQDIPLAEARIQQHLEDQGFSGVTIAITLIGGALSIGLAFASAPVSAALVAIAVISVVIADIAMQAFNTHVVFKAATFDLQYSSFKGIQDTASFAIDQKAKGNLTPQELEVILQFLTEQGANIPGKSPPGEEGNGFDFLTNPLVLAVGAGLLLALVID